jgi:hypothetical protein
VEVGLNAETINAKKTMKIVCGMFEFVPKSWRQRPSPAGRRSLTSEQALEQAKARAERERGG